MVRETIHHYLPDFRYHYQYENRKFLDFNLIFLNMKDFPFILSIWTTFKFILSHIYIRSSIFILCVAEHRRQLRDNQISEIIKSDKRHYLRDVSYSKHDIVDKIRYRQIVEREDEGVEKVSEVMLELQDMGVEFVEALRCIADVLKAIDHRNYTCNSLTIDIAEHSECHLKTMYELSSVNEWMGFRMFQCFLLKRFFIPSFISLDIGIVASHISDANTLQLKEYRQDVVGFWRDIFKTEHKVFKQVNKEYTRWMQTNGVSLCVLRKKKWDENSITCVEEDDMARAVLEAGQSRC